VPVKDIAKLILRLTGSRSRIVLKPLPVDDPKRRKPNIDRARQSLGWSPKVKLEDGLRRTIDYFSLKLLTAEVEPLASRRLGALPSARQARNQPQVVAH
jgi:hypothetical protein